MHSAKFLRLLILGVALQTAGIAAQTGENGVPFSVLTYNIENGGAQVDFAKTIEVIRKSGADVVGIQEAWGSTAALAEAMGWEYFDPRQHIISRYPLFEAPDSPGIYTLIEVQPGKFVAMANMHLPDEPYGPDLIRAGSSASDVEAMEKRVRFPTAVPFVEKLSELAADGVPVFLTGDFNSPSHIDWTQPTVGVLPNHRSAVIWPTTKFIQEKGLTDTLRELRPNPETDPIYTWPAGRPFIKGTIDGFNPSKEDLSDRVDFIYAAGPATTLESLIIGEPEYEGSDIHVTPWPSDHRAVVSRFSVIPAAVPTENLTRPSERMPKGKPSVSIPKTGLRAGEPLEISWSNAPGNRYDYIRITPVGATKLAWGDTIRLYTRGDLDGEVVYNQDNALGNWTDWYKTEENQWPLKPGAYDVKLMLDDGFTELAATQITIAEANP